MKAEFRVMCCCVNQKAGNIIMLHVLVKHPSSSKYYDKTCPDRQEKKKPMRERGVLTAGQCDVNYI